MTKILIIVNNEMSDELFFSNLIIDLDLMTKYLDTKVG